MNQLESLKKFTKVVADTGDINAIIQYHPQDATTNPSLILKAAKLSVYRSLFKDALIYARKISGDKITKLSHASDKLAINIGIEILKYIPGRVSTEIDARLSFNKEQCIEKAKNLVALYQKHDIDTSRILIKLAATWEGIKAAEELKKEGIQSNLTLLFSFAQARVCAEANIYLISPFVGRIYDWYKKTLPLNHLYDIEKDPGVKSVKNIFNYYKQHRYQTIIMGASFRNKEQILALAGCDCLTIAPILLSELSNSNQPIEQKLFHPSTYLPQPTSLTESEFRWEHNKDTMAVEKLSEGIRQFTKDQEQLEAILAQEL
ncbi:transaldolase [Candidatus Schneideria nysicola]|uniref:transaldolase n=1 Tax=Candidatus Schneideria nysicola TaxID=1081631 RepID=UPI001CAA760D|nr:transaldolase [Candidatus Schneideria nysicola]UAJ65729.1 transaldolase [Candidatus Schneideria nysicola]